MLDVRHYWTVCWSDRPQGSKCPRLGSWEGVVHRRGLSLGFGWSLRAGSSGRTRGCLYQEPESEETCHVLAGYHDDINHLLKSDLELSSRFPEVLDFQALSPHPCFELLLKHLERKKEGVEAAVVGNTLDATCLSSPSLRHVMLMLFERACGLKSWAIARNVIGLAESIFKTTIQITVITIIREMEALVNEREKRERGSSGGKVEQGGEVFALPIHLRDAPLAKSAASTAASAAPTAASAAASAAEELRRRIQVSNPDRTRRVMVRDVGASDEVWE
ncbi:hypothetical protein LIA77_03798 [Sarocladium implicatum]|nr:hypothetical protein LIA77_03798 [Sarocladium implicatum]